MKILKNQKGFTLIELIIVIVVLGVLAAVAIPNYIGMAADAQAAANLGYVAGLRSSISINFAAQQVRGATSGAPTPAPICFNGTTWTASTLAATQTGTALAACVTGAVPSSQLVFTANTPPTGSTWVGLSPNLTAGSAPASQTWTLAAATSVGAPLTITCSSAAVQC